VVRAWIGWRWWIAGIVEWDAQVDLDLPAGDLNFLDD
jgi:hypothetical protein